MWNKIKDFFLGPYITEVVDVETAIATFKMADGEIRTLTREGSCWIAYMSRPIVIHRRAGDSLRGYLTNHAGSMLADDAGELFPISKIESIAFEVKPNEQTVTYRR